jgi:hypothetical protein
MSLCRKISSLEAAFIAPPARTVRACENRLEPRIALWAIFEV